MRSTSIKKRGLPEPGPGGQDPWDEFSDRDLDDIDGGNFQVLETSLPGRLDENGEPLYDVPAFQPQSLGSDGHHAPPPPQRAPSTKTPKKSALKWHFGIRSRSPPMEVMHEIYKTLQVLGWEWKRKQAFEGPWDEDGRPLRAGYPSDKEKRAKEKQIEEKQNQGLFFVETRCKIQDTVVRMDLQLYRVDGENYLVDFRNVGYYYSTNDPDDYQRVRRGSEPEQPIPPSWSTESGSTIAARINAQNLVGDVGASMSGVDLLPGENPMFNTTNSAGQPTAGGSGKIKEVCSPFLFLEAACRLIVELASG